ncbi:hypothetical protein ABZ949_01810 [Micromonospora tulbaghiae]|uniref:hypothetical protein n=1 Tax=Micromonospora tulbaghiae TaxID=479978 RepID=UPI0033E695E9
MTTTTTATKPGPQACGTCRTAGRVDSHPIHQPCAQRATLIEAPDAPHWEALTDLTMEEKATLPARFHIPRFMDTCTPKAWVCAVCWDEGTVTQWPCAAATESGDEVFTPDYLVRQQP